MTNTPALTDITIHEAKELHAIAPAFGDLGAFIDQVQTWFRIPADRFDHDDMAADRVMVYIESGDEVIVAESAQPNGGPQSLRDDFPELVQFVVEFDAPSEGDGLFLILGDDGGYGVVGYDGDWEDSAMTADELATALIEDETTTEFLDSDRFGDVETAWRIGIGETDIRKAFYDLAMMEDTLAYGWPGPACETWNRVTHIDEEGMAMTMITATGKVLTNVTGPGEGIPVEGDLWHHDSGLAQEDAPDGWPEGV